MIIAEITLRDEFGNLINDVEKRTYQLELSDPNFNAIEKTVTDFKNQALPDLQADLLEQCQSDFIQKKGGNLRCNGTTPVTIKTLHGRFCFKLQRFIDENESQTTYFELTHQFGDGYLSDGLKEFSAFYSNRLSYEEIEDLLVRTVGRKQLSDQKIREVVVDKALEVSKSIKSRALEILGNDFLNFPVVNQSVDIYDINTKEVLIFEDGIQVKGQKDTREKAPKILLTDEKCDKASRVNSNVVLLEKKTGEFEYIIAPIDDKGEESLPLSDLVKSKIIEEYGDVDTPLNMVAITDGAKDIRVTLFAIFGMVIMIILDWYHLGKKLREYMSMIARNKEEKVEHLKFLFSHLWHGQTEEVLEYLKTKVKTKNEKKLQELITYLEKHKAEIIDYGRRKKVGKEIGRGLVKENEKSRTENSLISDDKNEESRTERSKAAEKEKDEQVVENSPVVEKIRHHQKVKTKKVIGSGRVEKGCDQVIGHRQKNKAMSWGKKGSRSLGILKVEELNKRWEALWFPKPAVNDSQLTAANDSEKENYHELPRAA